MHPHSRAPIPRQRARVSARAPGQGAVGYAPRRGYLAGALTITDPENSEGSYNCGVFVRCEPPARVRARITRCSPRPAPPRRSQPFHLHRKHRILTGHHSVVREDRPEPYPSLRHAVLPFIFTAALGKSAASRRRSTMSRDPTLLPRHMFWWRCRSRLGLIRSRTAHHRRAGGHSTSGRTPRDRDRVDLCHEVRRA